MKPKHLYLPTSVSICTILLLCAASSLTQAASYDHPEGRDESDINAKHPAYRNCCQGIPTQLMIYFPLVRNNYPISEAGKVVFASYRDNNDDIYSMNSDGSGVTRLTTDPSTDNAPDWSPDGSQIVFDSNRSGLFEIYVMNSDGSNQHQVTTNGDCFSPEWSPDGSRIAFTRDAPGGTVIMTMNPDGSGQFQVTDPSLNADSPQWSPNGTKITFFGLLTNYGIYAVNTDGSNPVPLYLYNYIGSYAWSPDGIYLALSLASPPNYNWDIYLYTLGSGALVRLSNTKLNHLTINWSPEGHQMIFSSNQDDLYNFEIYTMGIYGGQFTNLTNSPSPEISPDWTK